MFLTDHSQTFAGTPLFAGAPGQPAVDLQAASDSGASSSDDVTNVATPLFDIDLPSGFGDARDAVAGDVLQLEISDGVGFTDPIDDTLDAGEVAADVVALPPSAALAEGDYFARARLVRGARVGPWSATLAFTIDLTAPVISTGAAQSVNENATLAVTLAADESVTWSLTGGADQAKFEISGTTLRWLSNGVKDFEAPDDANTDNAYVVQVTATDLAGNLTNKTITVTVQDVAEGGTDDILMETGDHLLLETGDLMLME
jgi:hypothetical protein